MARKIDIQKVEENDISVQIVRDLRKKNRKGVELPPPLDSTVVIDELSRADKIIVGEGK